MRRSLRTGLVLAVVGFSSFVAPQKADATQVSLELRQTFRVRPSDLARLGAMLGLSLTDRWWAGAGYEFFQDYDAILYSSQDVGHKPIVMSGIRAGSWYRGGALKNDMTYSIGGIVTFANPAFSLSRSPSGLDNDTWVVDFGADLTLGYVWSRVRLGVFATPAWSYGRIVSPAVQTSERYSALTYRVGLAFAVEFGH